MYSVVEWLSEQFVFSSRRRHTRYIGDWSSDVCSSDLGKAGIRFFPPSCSSMSGANQKYVPGLSLFAGCSAEGDGRGVCRRSEERRVGKECGCRGRTVQYNRRE